MRLFLTLSFCLATLLSDCIAQEKTPRDIGAIGDGKADDTAALQKLIDSGTGAITLPTGTYRLTAPLRVELAKTGWISLRGNGTARLLMAGAGPALHFIGTHEGSAAPSTFKPGVWEKERSPMIDGIEIVGANPEANGIEATGTMQLTVTATTIRKARHGVHLTERNRNVVLANCHIYENSGCG